MAIIARSIKGNGIRNLDDRPLSKEQLMEFVPSIFGAEKCETRSERFAPVRTWDSIEALQREGFEPFYAIQTRVQDESRKESTRHMIRLRDTKMTRKNNDVANEIIIVNANDGTAAYNLMAGQFRFVCANGLVLGNIEQHRKVYHTGNAQDKVIESVYDVMEDYAEIEDMQERMKHLILTDKQRKDYANAAYWIANPIDTCEVLNTGRLPDMEYDSNILISPKRADDMGKDLFSTFNVAQERLTKGGIIRPNRRRTQAITNISKDINLNTSLWNLTKNVYEDNKVLMY